MRATRSHRRWAAAALAIGLAGACSADGDDGATEPATSSEETRAAEPAAEPSYPGDEWPTVEPAAAGFDPAALDRLHQAAGAAASTCLVVTRDGAVVDEHYWDGATAGTTRQAFSVTKSLTSTLVGIAQDEGLLALDDPAVEHIPEWRGTDSASVTVEDLLSGDSGRQWDFGTDYRDNMAIGAPDKTAFAVGLGQDAPPGEVWAYNNSAVQTLSAVLEAATGEDAAEYARSRLFEPIGMASSSMTTDSAGNVLTFMGLQSTCPDLARFGYLMLNDGAWEGEQVVSSDYVERATRRSSTDLNAAYGLLWWVNHEGAIASPAPATSGADEGVVAQGRLVPDAPDDAFWALGFRNQVVAVIPSEGIVAVRMGAAPPAGAPFGHAELTMGVLDALVDP